MGNETVKRAGKRDDRHKCGIGKCRLFFYIGIIVSVLCMSIVLLTACDDTSANKDTDGTVNREDISVVFVLNNGEADIVRTVGEDIPTPVYEDHILECWCIDEGLTNRMEDIAGLAEELSAAQKEIRVYAKWREKEEMNVHVKDALFVYDGNSHGLDITELPEGARIYYEGEGEYEDAGEYEIKGVIKADGYKDKEISGRLKIEKGKVEEETLKLVDATYVWDGEEHKVEIEGELPRGITVRYENNIQSEVGEYEVRVSFDTHGNYEEIAERRAKLTILEKTYTVRFVQENEEDITVTVGHGKGIEEIPKPREKRGYTAKWDDEDLDRIEEDRTVRVKYEIERYEIRYEANGGEIKGEYAREYTVEEERVLPEAEREHYIFNGWYEGEERVERIEEGSVGEKEYRAKWEAVVYNVEYELNGGMNDRRNIKGYTVEEEEKELYGAERTGYEFVCWREEGEEVKSIDPREGRDMVLYAEWKEVEYEIRYELRGGENADGNREKYSITNEEIELKDGRREGYEFAGWYENEECIGERIREIRGEWMRDITLYAKWEKIEVFDVIDGEIVKYDYGKGEEITVPKEVRGERVSGIAAGVLQGARVVRIEAEIEEIGERMFEGCERIEELTLPKTVKRIAEGALRDCISMKRLTVPYVGVREKGEEDGDYYPFGILFGEEKREGCYEVEIRVMRKDGEKEEYLQDIARKRYVPESLKEITVLEGEIIGYSFEGMRSIEKARVYGEKIGQGAFKGCSGLKEARIESEECEVHVTSFYNSGLETVYVRSEGVQAQVQEAIRVAKEREQFEGDVSVIQCAEQTEEEKQTSSL